MLQPRLDNPKPFPVPSYQLPFTSERGFITLVSAVLVGAISVAIAASLLQLGVQQTRVSLAIQQSTESRALANACTEYALNQLRRSLMYAGAETLTLGNGTCEIETVSGSGNTNRVIQTTAMVGTVVRKIEVNVATVRNIMVISDWQEVANY